MTANTVHKYLHSEIQFLNCKLEVLLDFFLFVGEDDRKVIEQALTEWATQTCVQFQKVKPLKFS